MGEIRLGCSGWSYDHWRDFLYKGVSPQHYLEHYAKFFNCVEVNMTFYRFPTAQMLENWFERTPDYFLFTIKMNRSITHMKKLQGVGRLLESFIDICLRLGTKLGPLLVQLSSNLSKDTRRLENFLAILPDIRVAFEFRNKSWFDYDIFKLLNKYNATLVMLGSQFDKNYTVYPNFAYIRWHGRGGQLDNYSQDEISYWANRIRAISESTDLYGFWNNDAFAYAPKNCLDLLKKLELR
jgi:uncharacterized protein YecE (DUF72 family)